MTVPARLNNYPVLFSIDDDHDSIVLVFREGHEAHPFVVAFWMPNLGTTWHAGDYCGTLPEALKRMEYRSSTKIFTQEETR